MSKDYYNILGVSKDATKADIKRAYRRLAIKYHPDKGQGGDEKKFREVNQAYEVLSDDQKRQQYDQFGQTFEQAGQSGFGSGFGGFGGFDFSNFRQGFGQNYSQGPFAGMEFDFGDIFSDIFGSPRSRRQSRGIDLEMELEIDFMESVFGVEKDVQIQKKDSCTDCKGSGAESGSDQKVCPVCHGQGQIVKHKKTILGSFQRYETCDKCFGRGKVPEKECKVCKGAGSFRQNKKLKISIPSGIENGQRIKLTGEGEVGYQGSSSGDLYVRVKVRPSDDFKRQGFDIINEVPISFYQAALGAKIDIATVDGEVELQIPSGIQSGKVLRLRGKGVPHHSGNGRGDHLAIIRVVTPKKLSKKEKELFSELAKEQGESADVDKGFWEKIRDSL